MNQKIRISIHEDATAFLAIKEQLSLSFQSESSSQGGFLLGTDLATYQFYIEHASCLTALVDEQIVGFGIILPDMMIRNSELWTKRHATNWNTDIDILEKSKLAYLEQLAFLKGNRKLALLLAYKLAKSAFDHNTDSIITTTVRKPILNLAALPYIKAVGGILIGNIDETYPSVGAINSDIYLLQKESFLEKAKAHPLFEIIEKSL